MRNRIITHLECFRCMDNDGKYSGRCRLLCAFHRSCNCTYSFVRHFKTHVSRKGKEKRTTCFHLPTSIIRIHISIKGLCLTFAWGPPMEIITKDDDCLFTIGLIRLYYGVCRTCSIFSVF